MKSQTLNTTQYKSQVYILKELEQLKKKMMILGSLRRFENLTKQGRRFAKQKKIKQSDVIKND